MEVRSRGCSIADSYNGWATIVMLPLRRDCCVDAPTMTSFDVKSLCAAPTASFPFHAYASGMMEIWIIKSVIRKIMWNLILPLIHIPASPVPCRFSFEGPQCSWWDAQMYFSGLPGKRDPLLEDFGEIKWDELMSLMFVMFLMFNKFKCHSPLLRGDYSSELSWTCKMH